MNSVRSLLVILVILFGCSDDNDNQPLKARWRKLGLNGKTVNEMQLQAGNLCVATTTGLFRGRVGDENTDFSLLGFDGENVESIAVVGEETIIVSVCDKSGEAAPALYTTSDAGDTWLSLENNFGGNHAEPVFDLELHPQQENVLYAAGFSVVAKSSDHGHTWAPIYGDWGGFATGISVVEINPNDVNEVWAGGQGAIENGILVRSKNDADWDSWSDLVENPTVVKEITFNPGNKEQLFVGFEGELLTTMDGGVSWQTLIESEENRFYFGIGLRDGDHKRLYAGGWLKTSGPQPLTLYVSDTGGKFWHEIQFPGESYGGILELQIKPQEGKDILYLGLDKGGVYEVTFSR